MDTTQSKTLNNIEVDVFLDMLWGYKDKITMEMSPRFKNILEQLMSIEGNYNSLFHIQMLPRDKSIGRDEDLFVCWKRHASGLE